MAQSAAWRRAAPRLVALWCGAAALGVALQRQWLDCPFAALTGLPCPACGSGRALRALWAGDFPSFWRHNLLAPLSLLLLALALVWGSAEIVRAARGQPPLRALGRRLAGALVVVHAAQLLVWIVRWFGLLGGPVAV